MRRKPVAFREFLEENLPLFDVAYNEYCMSVTPFF
jgi:hypothetical protein